MIRFLLIFLFLLGATVQYPLRATTPPAPLNGQWKGPLKVLGGEINLIITIVPLSNGTYYAALDAPQQRISRMPVEVVVKGSDISLRIEQAGSSFQGKVLDGGARFSGTWKQPGLTAPLVLKRAAAASPPPSANLRLTPPYRESEVTFANPAAKVRLSGTLTVPAGEGPFPAVVLVSDSGPHNREVELQDYRMFGQLADYLTRRGIAVLRYDDRGVGKSTGTYADATTADLATDAQAALRFLRTQPLIAGSRVGLLGHGEGANVALLAAAAKPRPPAFVVSLAGYGQPGYNVLLRQQGEIMRLIGADPAQVKAARDLYSRTVTVIRETPDNTAARARVAALLGGANTGLDAGMARARATQLTSPWSRFFFDFDPTAKLSEVESSVLLLNGTADLQVSASRNLPVLYRTLHRTNRAVTSRRLVGVNHLFQAPPGEWPLVNGAPKPMFAPQALKVIHEWVRNETRLPGTAQPAMVKQPVVRKLVSRVRT